MASILILSQNGSGIPVGLRLASEGHIVKFWFKDAKARTLLEGYRNPSRVGDPKKMIDQYDLVIADMAGSGELCDSLSDQGKLVIGGGRFNDKLELDREYGERVAKQLLQVKIPNSETCNSKEELLKVLDSGTPMVVKPMDNQSTCLTLVSSDPGNRTIKSLATREPDLIPCLVQEKKPGIEISTEGWFNGSEFIKPFNHTIEHKRFLVGDRGPNTGCMGNIVWATEGDKLVDYAIKPLEQLLKKVSYLGPIDVNCIVTQSDAYFLEFTPRMGYDAIQALSELIKGDSLFDYLYGIASGHLEEAKLSDSYGIAVRMSVAPYPSKGDAEKWKGAQLLALSKESGKHVWLMDVMRSDGLEVIAGTDGILGCVTAWGTSVKECQRRAYRTVRNICLSDDIQYRTDIGEGAEEKIKKLTEWGWLTAREE